MGRDSDHASWPDELILWLYRARWQIELLFKRMKTFLKMHVLPHEIERACLVVKLLLIGWALYEQEIQQMWYWLHDVAMVSASESGTFVELIVSSWTLTALSLESLQPIVWGGWTQQRLFGCLPWLQRYLCHRPRKCGHQETEIRVFLLSSSSPLWKRGNEVVLV